MRPRTTWILAFLFVAGVARAGTDDVEHAKTYFNAGARAYDAGDFLTAIDMFESAEKLAPRPSIVFSIAQAHRREYFVHNKPEHLRIAVERFRAYIDAVPPGQGRRAEAAQLLAELAPLADKLAPDAPVKAPEPKHTKINVSSPAPGARIACDGGKPTEPGTPLTLETTPGKHRCVVSADGFVDAIHEVTAVEGEFIPVEVPLVERPAHLVIDGADGAQVSVDGRTIGTAGGALDVVPGVHLVSVTRNGRSPMVKEIELARGEEKKISAQLHATAQRKLAYGLFALGGAGALATGAFAIAAVIENDRAKQILDKQNAQNITESDRATYLAARSARDAWTTATIVGGIASAGVLGTAVFLYAFDQSNPTGPTEPVDLKARPKQQPEHKLPGDLALIPSFVPGFVGAAIGGRFE